MTEAEKIIKIYMSDIEEYLADYPDDLNEFQKGYRFGLKVALGVIRRTEPMTAGSLGTFSIKEC